MERAERVVHNAEAHVFEFERRATPLSTAQLAAVGEDGCEGAASEAEGLPAAGNEESERGSPQAVAADTRMLALTSHDRPPTDLGWSENAEVGAAQAGSHDGTLATPAMNTADGCGADLSQGALLGAREAEAHGVPGDQERPHALARLRPALGVEVAKQPTPGKGLRILAVKANANVPIDGIAEGEYLHAVQVVHSHSLAAPLPPRLLLARVQEGDGLGLLASRAAFEKIVTSAVPGDTIKTEVYDCCAQPRSSLFLAHIMPLAPFGPVPCITSRVQMERSDSRVSGRSLDDWRNREDDARGNRTAEQGARARADPP